MWTKSGANWDRFSPPLGDRADAVACAEDGVPEMHPLSCARCDRPLDFVGTKKFHEGRRWGLLGELGELFVKREHFDVYVCPRCGRVELFVDGIGEEFRPH